MAIIQQRQVSWARRVLGLFVVVWLNMALQPCAMAFGDANDHDCPHCPPAHSEKHSSHSAHEADHSDHQASPCENGASQCAFVDGFNYDGRTVKVKVKDAPSDLPIGVLSSIAGHSFEGNFLQLSDICDKSYVPPYRSSLNDLYCVYLI